MRKLSLLLILILGMFYSCSCDYQYGVRVYNGTQDIINIDFKSLADTAGTIEKSIILNPGDTEVIIWTHNLSVDPECNGMKPEHCIHVAEYVNASQNGVQSTKQWCDDDIKFSISDIGQSEFVIEYSPSDFPK